MEIASLKIPSPKIRENSLGCSSSLTIVSAATVSEEQSRADIRRISLVVN